MSNLRPLSLALGLSLAAALATPDVAAKAKRKPTAKKPAAEHVTACDDFYTWSLRSWLQTNAPNTESGMTSALLQLRQRAMQQQIDLLDADRSASNGIGKALGDFWASGLDEQAVERDGANPIAPLLQRIDGIRKDKDIAPAVAALHQIGIPVLFNFTADLDLKDLNRHIGYFTQGGLALPDPAWYTRTDADTRALFARYREYVRQILTLTGANPDRLDADVDAVIDIETRIAGLSKPLDALRDPRVNYAPVAVAGLAKRYKRLQLEDFLKAQGVDTDTVSLADPKLFTRLDSLVDRLKPEQWKAYLRYQVGAAMAPYLSKPWRKADFQFRGRILRGQSAPPSRRQHVLEAINLAAGPMLGRRYLDRHLPAAAQERANAIAGQLRKAMARAIDANTWMSEAGKREARAKLEKLKIEIGAPTQEMDYTVQQPMGRGSFGSNMLIASTWRHREEMRLIGKGNASRRWTVLPQDPVLAYDMAHNRLIVTAAILQAPVLDMTASGASHYGALGALLGHELSHAFDNRGRMVDAAGNVKDWWTPTDQNAWETRADQLTTLYGTFPYPDAKGVFVNGKLTRDENAADLSGIELAWNALQTAHPNTGREGAKSFFQSWAKLWSQRMTADVAILHAATDVHAPGRWRGNGPLINLPAFADTYTCKAGTRMKPSAGQPPVSFWNLQSASAPVDAPLPASPKKK